MHSRAAQVINYHSELLQAVGQLEQQGAIQKAGRLHLEAMVGIYRSVTSDDPWPLPVLPDIQWEAFRFSKYLTVVNLWFIIAHEFAHIHLAHLADCRRVNIAGTRAAIQVNRYNRSQQQEFEADALALAWMLAIGEHSEDSVALFAKKLPVACLEIFTLFSFIETSLGRHGKSTLTHPSARDRLQFLFQEHSGRLTKDAKAIMENWIESMDKSRYG